MNSNDLTENLEIFWNICQPRHAIIGSDSFPIFLFIFRKNEIRSTVNVDAYIQYFSDQMYLICISVLKTKPKHELHEVETCLYGKSISSHTICFSVQILFSLLLHSYTNWLLLHRNHMAKVSKGRKNTSNMELNRAVISWRKQISSIQRTKTMLKRFSVEKLFGFFVIFWILYFRVLFCARHAYGCLVRGCVRLMTLGWVFCIPFTVNCHQYNRMFTHSNQKP